ncbi:MAG: amino acid permease [Endomicrobiales bacterium]|nr:amino acid permease [Endomicrobiales bacterium]
MNENLQKQLGLIDIICIATGAMVSSGLFILPGLAFAKAGPAVILSYLVAGVLCIPTLLSKAELTTAMPKAGGDYFYIMRGFGPLLGTMAGFSSWLSLSLKGAFALIGMAAYLNLFTNLPIKYIALICCLFFVVLNLKGVKEAGKFQVLLVFGLVGILIFYVLLGVKSINTNHFSPFFSRGMISVFSTASFVFISYGGLTKVAAISEEVRNPGKNLPLGMLISILLTSLLYTLVIYITIGVVNPQDLKTTLIPISDGAFIIGGNPLAIIISVGAFLAFISTANAGIMTASRYPLGMSRDNLLPPVFEKISARFHTPYLSILLTGAFMLFSIWFLKLELLVKIASAVLILLFMFANLTLILFRESKILSYKPKFHSPLYPYVQILGIIGGIFLLIEMGSKIVFLMGVFLVCAGLWYKFYAQEEASQDTALIYALERLVSKDKELAGDSLLTELKDIVVERDAVIEDRFHKLVEEAQILDIEEPLSMRKFFREISALIGKELNADSKEFYNQFVEREKESSTIVRERLAIPHIIVQQKDIFKILLVRAKEGIVFPNDKLAHIIFVIVGSQNERNFHLKVLAAIAQITQNPNFDREWMNAKDIEELRHIVLLAERRRE